MVEGSDARDNLALEAKDFKWERGSSGNGAESSS